MPVFFEVGLVLLMPIVAEAARRSGRPPILVGMPLLAGLSIVHGTLPPHPAAMLAVTQYHADMGRTILLGLAAGLPAAVLAGPGLGWLMLRRWKRRKAKGAAGLSRRGELPLFALNGRPRSCEIEHRAEAAESMPAPAGPIRAASAILLPVALIFLGSWADTLAAPGGLRTRFCTSWAAPDVALLIAVLVALVTLGGHNQTGKIRARRACAS